MVIGASTVLLPLQIRHEATSFGDVRGALHEVARFPLKRSGHSSTGVQVPPKQSPAPVHSPPSLLPETQRLTSPVKPRSATVTRLQESVAFPCILVSASPIFAALSGSGHTAPGVPAFTAASKHLRIPLARLRSTFAASLVRVRAHLVTSCAIALDAKSDTATALTIIATRFRIKKMLWYIRSLLAAGDLGLKPGIGRLGPAAHRWFAPRCAVG